LNISRDALLEFDVWLNNMTVRNPIISIGSMTIGNENMDVNITIVRLSIW
jgi:hypothetical protein